MSHAIDTPLTLSIASKTELAAGIVGFVLEDPSGKELPAFTPGAHIAIATPSGRKRKYSLYNAPSDRGRYEIALKRESRRQSATTSLIDGTQVGDTVQVSLPENNFELKPSQGGYVLIAGGIGITPLLSMLRYLEESGEKRFKLYYCTRSPAQTAFLNELGREDLEGRVVLHHDGGVPERNFDFWPVLESPGGRQVYCCGPQSLMREVQDMTGHWPSTAVHFESFADSTAGRPDDKAFRVRLARSGDVIDVPVGISILDALRAHGHELRSSCESGTCGTCITRYLAGEPDHRDFVLHADGRAASIMICVSRARSDELVLDL